jgi:hypothetical protein
VSLLTEPLGKLVLEDVTSVISGKGDAHAI